MLHRCLALLLILGLSVVAIGQDSAKFAGTWKFKAKAGGFDQIMNIANDDGKWTIHGTFEKDGTAAGAYVGTDVKYADGVLTWRRQFTKKPAKNWEDEDAATLRLEGSTLVASFQTKQGQKAVRQFDKVLAQANEVAKNEVAKKEPPQDRPFAGSWKVIDPKKLDETWTFTPTDKGWKISGVFSNKDGTEAGACHGGSVRITLTALSFTRLIDKSPGPEYKSGVEYAFTVKGDRGEFTLRSGKTITKQKLERFDPAKVVAAAKKTPDPAVKSPSPDTKTPTPEPKTPDPKTAAKDPKTPEPAAKSLASFTKVAAFAAAKQTAADMAALSPDGKYVATVSSAKTDEAAIWDVSTKKVVQKLSAGAGLSRLVWSADGKTLATMSIGTLVGAIKGQGVPPRKVIAWDTTTWEQLAQFEERRVGSSLAISGNGRYVAATDDGIVEKAYVKVWDVAAKKEILSLPHTGVYIEVVLSADGKTLCTHVGPPAMGDAFLYDLPSDKPRLGLKKANGKLAMAGDASIVAAAMYSDGICRVAVFDTRSPKTPKIIDLGKWAPLGVTFIDDNRHIVVAGTHDDVHVCNVATGKVVQTFTPSKIRGTNIVKTNADSSLLLTYGNDHIARLWSTPFGPKAGGPP